MFIYTCTCCIALSSYSSSSIYVTICCFTIRSIKLVSANIQFQNYQILPLRYSIWLDNLVFYFTLLTVYWIRVISCNDHQSNEIDCHFQQNSFVDTQDNRCIVLVYHHEPEKGADMIRHGINYFICNIWVNWRRFSGVEYISPPHIFQVHTIEVTLVQNLINLTTQCLKYIYVKLCSYRHDKALLVYHFNSKLVSRAYIYCCLYIQSTNDKLHSNKVDLQVSDMNHGFWSESSHH